MIMDPARHGGDVVCGFAFSKGAGGDRQLAQSTYTPVCGGFQIDTAPGDSAHRPVTTARGAGSVYPWPNQTVSDAFM